MFKKKEKRITIPESKIKTRIKDLFRKIKKCRTYIDRWNKKYIGTIELTMDGFGFAYVIILNTAYGERSVLVTESSLKYMENNYLQVLKNKSKQELTKLDILNKVDCLFYIDSKKGVQLYPKTTKLTYEEIDLAILEFEQLVNKMFIAAIKQEEYIKGVESKLRG